MIRRALRRLAAVADGAFRAIPDPGRIVAICHCHHIELVPELATILRRLPVGASLHITSSRAAVLERWRDHGPLPSRPLLHLVENRGRDLRPFFDVARDLPADPDTIVLKIHGKRSDYSAKARHWRRDLLAGLLPGRRTPGVVARRFRDNPRLGMLGAPRSFISHPVYWGENRPAITKIMRDAFGTAPSEEDLGFFAGSMFWIRGALLSQLLPHIDLEAFEPEPLAQDGSYAHAIERVVSMAALRMGWEMGEVGDPAPLDPHATRERKLPYL